MRTNTRVYGGKARIKTTRVTSRDGVLRSPTFDDVTATTAPTMQDPVGDDPPDDDPPPPDDDDDCEDDDE